MNDTRVEARRIADELDRLQLQESVLGEDFDQSQLALSGLRLRVDVAQHRVALTNHEAARRRNELGRYAVAAYTRGTDEPLRIVLHSAGDDFGRRQTYESLIAGNQADLIDALRAATSDQHAAVEQLGRAQREASKARADLDRKRNVVTSLIAEQQQILSRVQGRLKVLVAQAEAERAAAAAAAVHAAAVRDAAAAHAAAPPAPPRQVRPQVSRPHAHRSVRPTKHRVITPRPATNPAPDVAPSTTAPSITTTPAPPPTPPSVTTTLAPAPTPAVTTTPPPEPVPTPPVTVAPPITTPASPVPAGPPPTTAPPSVVTTAPPAGGDVVKWAETRLGSPYIWGAAGPNDFDCSGLVLWSFAQAGRGSLPHSSRAMYAMSLHIPLSALQPGDLVFFGQPVHHVGIYVGGGTMIDALNSRTPVAFHSIYGIAETPIAGRI